MITLFRNICKLFLSFLFSVALVTFFNNRAINSQADTYGSEKTDAILLPDNEVNGKNGNDTPTDDGSNLMQTFAEGGGVNRKHHKKKGITTGIARGQQMSGDAYETVYGPYQPLGGNEP